jgi:DNA-binding transcriptional regulator YhcF (GntR family)
MDLLISMHSDIPIYEQIKDQIKKLIIHQRLKKDEQLPSIRTLAKDLQVGIVTVKRAYDDLVLDGYVYAKSAKGYYVAETDEESIKKEYLKRIEHHMHMIESLKKEARLSDQDIENLWKHKGGNKDV